MKVRNTLIITIATKLKILKIPKQIIGCRFAWVFTQNDSSFYKAQCKKKLVTEQCSFWSCDFCFVKCVICVEVEKEFNLIQLFPANLFEEIKRTRHGEFGLMKMVKRLRLIKTKLSLTIIFRKEKRAFVWDKPVPDIRLPFCPNFLSLGSLDLFGFPELMFTNFLKICFCLQKLCRSLWFNLTSPGLWTIFFLKTNAFFSLDWNVRY